jgi:hypothetical protein
LAATRCQRHPGGTLKFVRLTDLPALTRADIFVT